MEGQKASNTLNMYGIYDINGGTTEKVAGYIANGNHSLKYYGESVAYDSGTLKTESTKYATVYPYDNIQDNEDMISKWTEEIRDSVGKANYSHNKYIFGDAIREISTDATRKTSWNEDYSYFIGGDTSFFSRSGYYRDVNGAGLFFFHRGNGSNAYHASFRTAIVAL